MLCTNLKQINNIFIKKCIDFSEYYIHFFIVSLSYILGANASRINILKNNGRFLINIKVRNRIINVF